MGLDDKKYIKLLHKYEEMLMGIFFGGLYFQQNPRIILNSKNTLRHMIKKRKITDRESFEQHIEWLFNTGTRKRFNSYYVGLSCMTSDERNKYLVSLQDSPIEHQEVEFVVYYLNRLSVAGIAAYDIACMNCCVAGAYKLKFISKAEHIMYLDKIVTMFKQYNFNRQEYINSFVIGTTFDTIQEQPEIDWRNQPEGVANSKRGEYIRLIISKLSPFKWVGL